MRLRVVLPIVALVASGEFVRAGEGGGLPTGEAFLSHMRGGRCQVGQVQPVLSVPPDDSFAYRLFEGVAVARNGDVYTQEQCTGDVYRIEGDGTASVIATIDYGVQNDFYCNQAGGLGLTMSADGDPWLVVISWGAPESHGVWRVGQDGLAELAVPMSVEEAPAPNALAFDPRGSIYVTESFLGGIWKASPGGEATLWLQSDLLLPPPGSWFGANGIAYRHHSLYVANSDQGTIVRIPIRRNGSPGEPTVIASGLVGPDGLAFDALGDLYAVTAYGGELVRIRRGTEPEVVVDLRAAGVDYPTSVAFRRRPLGADTAYIANFFILEGQPNLGVQVQMALSGQSHLKSGFMFHRLFDASTGRTRRTKRELGPARGVRG